MPRASIPTPSSVASLSKPSQCRPPDTLATIGRAPDLDIGRTTEPVPESVRDTILARLYVLTLGGRR